MLPADFGSASLAFRTETCVLKPVVAPHERSKTTARVFLLGAVNSNRTLFSHRSPQATNQTDNTTSEIPALNCDTAHRSRGQWTLGGVSFPLPAQACGLPQGEAK